MFLGIRTVVYPASDLDEATSWWTTVLGHGPYFHESFYVGFNVGGYELALDPGADLARGPVVYWGVRNADDAVRSLLAAGAKPGEPVRDVGDSIRLATVVSPAGMTVGIIENPHFEVVQADENSAGPGR
ncbi:glyoxalase [Streptomyces canus]|uniref:VOC family protein n=1 Tax=Streptomyces canus TaxID=58343 RepID=UPI0030E218B0